MKLTVTVKSEVETNYDIMLPHYCKSKTSYYKIIDENTAIKVEYWNAQYYGISVISPEFALKFSDNNCNSDEFYTAFEQVSKYINHITKYNENI